MSTILPSLDAIQARADAATEGPWEVEEGTNAVVASAAGHAHDRLRFRGVAEDVYTAEDRALIASARTDVPALVAALRAVLDLHIPEWSCGNPAHTNPDVGCPDCAEYCTDCDQPWPCPTFRAVAAHIDTPKEKP